MNDEEEMLREVFSAHEYLAPDPVAVRAGIRTRARAYARRRKAAQAAGGAVLGAGLVTAGVAAPYLARNSSTHGTSSVSALGVASVPASPSAISSQDADRAMNAYFNAGYNYDDAMLLAKIWNVPGDALTVKAAAGRKLLAGETLPIKPSSTPASPVDAAESADIDAFFNAGYTYDDAVQLGKLWKMSDLYQVKATAGEKVAAGETLPIAPGSTATDKQNAAAAADVDAFFNAGYTYDDAVELGKLWNNSDTYQVKVTAGQKLIAGETLPIKP